MEITYCSTYWDLCRCSFYSLTHRREILLMLAIPVILKTVSHGHAWSQCGWLQFPIAASLALLQLAAIILVVMQCLIVWRVLKPIALRRCVTQLTPHFLADVTTRKTTTIPWSAISQICHHQGDIFFFRKGKDSVFVPRSAFNHILQSQTFYETALDFWNAVKSGRIIDPLQDETVWPPAPRIIG